ncbi:hypothetical protein GOP47_0028083 [Adiantum capillus-veneris]|nr:hypothetical protein GOP47_0028083 [Adiantum capillus-veneris]
MYGNCKALCSAEKIFWGMVSMDVVAWNMMIASLTSNNHIEDALEYFHSMQNQGFIPMISLMPLSSMHVPA